MAQNNKIAELEKKIAGYKFICKLAGVPQILIDFPEVLNPVRPTKKDIAWVKKWIDEYEKSKMEEHGKISKVITDMYNQEHEDIKRLAKNLGKKKSK